MLKDGSQSEAADMCFSNAMDLATLQGASFWQLRCAISIAQLRMEQDQGAEALAVLEAACGAMVEESDISDMRIARGLIAQLRT